MQREFFERHFKSIYGRIRIPADAVNPIPFSGRIWPERGSRAELDNAFVDESTVFFRELVSGLYMFVHIVDF